MFKISETVTEQRRRPSRRLVELIREKLLQIEELHEEIIRLKHEIGMAILNDPNYQSFQARGNQRFSHNQQGFVRQLADALEVSVSNLHHCIKFATKFPDLNSFIMHYKGQLGENFTWFYIVHNLLYEPREVTETVSEEIEQEQIPTMEETLLRRTIVRDVTSEFGDMNEWTTILQALREHKLTRREDVAELIRRLIDWRNGEEVTTFLGRPLPSDMPFGDALSDIARYVKDRRFFVAFKWELLDKVEETYSRLSDAPSDLREYIRNCVRNWIEFDRSRTRTGDIDESENQD